MTTRIFFSARPCRHQISRSCVRAHTHTTLTTLTLGASQTRTARIYFFLSVVNRLRPWKKSLVALSVRAAVEKMQPVGFSRHDASPKISRGNELGATPARAHTHTHTSGVKADYLRRRYQRRIEAQTRSRCDAETATTTCRDPIRRPRHRTRQLARATTRNRAATRGCWRRSPSSCAAG